MRDLLGTPGIVTSPVACSEPFGLNLTSAIRGLDSAFCASELNRPPGSFTFRRIILELVCQGNAVEQAVDTTHTNRAPFR